MNRNKIIEILNKHSVKAAPAGSVIFNCDFDAIADELSAGGQEQYISSYCGNPLTSEDTCQVLAKNNNSCEGCKYREFTKKEPIVDDSERKRFEIILLKHQIENKTCLTSNEIHTVWNALLGFKKDDNCNKCVFKVNYEAFNERLLLMRQQPVTDEDIEAWALNRINAQQVHNEYEDNKWKKHLIQGAKAMRDGKIK